MYKVCISLGTVAAGAAWIRFLLLVLLGLFLYVGHPSTANAFVNELNAKHSIALAASDAAYKAKESLDNKKILQHPINNSSREATPKSWLGQVVTTMTSPTIAYMLLLIGIYGIIFELISPGFIVPGFVGIMALLLSLYALHSLPINYTGFILLLLGVGFIIAEGFASTFGILGLSGTIAFVLGSMMLVNSSAVGYQIAWQAIGLMAMLNIFILVLLIGALVKSRQQKLRNGLRTLIGATGRTLGPINLKGQAVIRGEIWSVHARVPIAGDKTIRVVQAIGLLLEIEEDL